MNSTIILPAINTNTFAELESKIRIVEGLVAGHPAYAHWAHIDVSDGSASSISRWHEPKDLVKLHTTLKLELHLMERVSIQRLHEWHDHNVSRIFVHPELVDDLPALFAYSREVRMELGLALFRNSDISVVSQFMKECAGILILAVTPGMSGEEMDLETLTRIQKIRALNSNIPITIDGGVRVGVAQDAIRHGATRVVASSAIFQQLNPKDAYERLHKDAESGRE